MIPKWFWFFFAWGAYQKYAEFYPDIKFAEIIGKKVHTEKVICQTLLQVDSLIEEDKHKFCTLFLPITFLLTYFSHFSQQFQNQRKILRCFDTHTQLLRRKRFYVIVALLWNIRGQRHKILKNVFYKSVLELLFTPLYS